MKDEIRTDKETRDAIRREQVRLAMRQLPTMQVTSFIVALALSYSVRATAPYANILSWLSALLLVVVSRIVIYYRFLNVREGLFDGERWERVYLLLALASGIVWGSSAFIIFPAENHLLIALFVLVMASLSAATTVSHSSIRLAPAAWAVPALLLYAVRNTMEGGEPEYILGFLIIVYLVTIISYSFHHNRTIAEAISLKFENLKLLEKVAELKYRTLFEQSPDGILLIDTKGSILDFNTSAHLQLGYSREEFAKLRLADIDPAGSQDEIEEKLQEMLRKGKTEHDVRHRTKQGEIRDVHIITQVLVLSGRTLLHSIWRDVTERRLLEEEQHKTQKLEAIGTLAGGIAHDFNNLLQAIFTYISLAKMNLNQKEKALAKLQQAEKALNTAVGLTTQLLTFSKGGKPVKTVTSLKAVIENSADFALSGSRSASHIVIDEDLWPVQADAGQIGQVIQNIVLNASEAMPDGGTVTITATNTFIPINANPLLPEGGKFVTILIEDSGVGIPGQYLSRIFDPYFTTKQKGSGLGLGTSYSILRNHGGAIEVRSEVGKGSMFSIYLPAIDLGEELQVRVHSLSAGRRGKILVMDDEELIRDAARELLQSLGHEVECAVDGDAAVEKFILARQSGRPFDVVILDLTVKGGMGGEQTIKKLRELDPGVRAIVSSGYADTPVVSDFSSYGFAAYLNKPYTVDALHDSLIALLGQQ